MTHQKQLTYLIVITAAIHTVVASITELGNDEVYYYTYAMHLQWNYFDHPPIVALLIRLTTMNLLFTNELFVRLGSILCAAIGTWLSYKAGMLIKNERTGWYAAILFNTSIYTSIIAGTFILPDSPQVVFWLAALIVLLKLVRQLTDRTPLAIGTWLLFALFTGISILCKVHGIFIWVGFTLYLFFYCRRALSQWQLYIAICVTALIISPIIWWNINNDFVTWTYHSNRVAVHDLHININGFLRTIFGQIFYNNPINVALIAIAIYFYRAKKFLKDDIYTLLLFTGLPIIIVLCTISIFDSVLPHWSGPGFLSLNLVAAAYLDEVGTFKIRYPVILKIGLGLIVIAIGVGAWLIHFYPGTLGSKKESEYGKGDFTLDLYGWNIFKGQYKSWMQQQSDWNYYKKMKLVCNKWFPAAHIGYYIAWPSNTDLIGVGYLTDLHNFAWLNKAGEDLKKGEDALCIIPSNYPANVESVYKNEFSSIIKLHRFIIYRNGEIARFFTLYVLKNYQAIDEVHKMSIQ